MYQLPSTNDESTIVVKINLSEKVESVQMASLKNLRRTSTGTILRVKKLGAIALTLLDHT